MTVTWLPWWHWRSCRCLQIIINIFDQRRDKDLFLPRPRLPLGWPPEGSRPSEWETPAQIERLIIQRVSSPKWVKQRFHHRSVCCRWADFRSVSHRFNQSPVCFCQIRLLISWQTKISNHIFWMKSTFFSGEFFCLNILVNDWWSVTDNQLSCVSSI